jgi:hypothetical protein
MNTELNWIAQFEARKNKKALGLTVLIIGAMLALAVLVSWELPSPPLPVAQEFLEINLGNDIEGFGKVQPLVKGEKAPSVAVARQPRAATAPNKVDDIKTDENPDKESAPVNKPVKAPAKITTPAPVVVPEPKPQKPKIAGYNGPKGGTGNGATEDNGYRYEGNKPGGKGDAGSPNGKPDSYGNTPGGKSGGPRVTSGDRKIVRYYSFTGDLEKATIYAIIKVSPDGRGQFAGFGRNSTNRNPSYGSAISEYLRNIQFDKADHESDVTVQFNFNVN